jgi:hypothetical protein
MVIFEYLMVKNDKINLFLISPPKISKRAFERLSLFEISKNKKSIEWL